MYFRTAAYIVSSFLNSLLLLAYLMAAAMVPVSVYSWKRTHWPLRKEWMCTKGATKGVPLALPFALVLTNDEHPLPGVNKLLGKCRELLVMRRAGWCQRPRSLPPARYNELHQQGVSTGCSGSSTQMFR